MRERRRTPILTVLALTFVALVVTPIAALAASGLPATVTMTPENAGPGASVEVTGLDFPANAAVDLQLTTLDGAVYLGTASTADGGYFQESVVLPADAPAGNWELRATGADGAVAVHLFEAGDASAVVAAEAPLAEEIAAASGSAGNSTGDIVVMLVFAVLIAVVGGGIAYVYYQTKHGHEQPGMSMGEDPIWGGASDESEPSASVPEEPIWNIAPSES